MKLNLIRLFILLFTFGIAEGAGVPMETEEGVYLFTSFRGNGDDGLHLAYSSDGLEWSALNDDQSFVKPEVGGKLMRDSCLIEGPDGIFHMVWTTGWEDRGIGVAHSGDLINWSRQEFVSVMEGEATARNCWAPEIIWDPEGKQYVIYWATTYSDRFTETSASGDKGWNHRIYGTTTKDFKEYTETRLFYEPGFNVIDSTIIAEGGGYLMVMKDETLEPPAKNLRLARSDRVTGPWSEATEAFSPKGLWLEGPTAVKIGTYWYVYFDAYMTHRYGVLRTEDFKDWEDVSNDLRMPKWMRHGSVLKVSKGILEGLLEVGKKEGVGD